MWIVEYSGCVCVFVCVYFVRETVTQFKYSRTDSILLFMSSFSERALRKSYCSKKKSNAIDEEFLIGGD